MSNKQLLIGFILSMSLILSGCDNSKEEIAGLKAEVSALTAKLLVEKRATLEQSRREESIKNKANLTIETLTAQLEASSFELSKLKAEIEPLRESVKQFEGAAIIAQMEAKGLAKEVEHYKNILDQQKAELKNKEELKAKQRAILEMRAKAKAEELEALKKQRAREAEEKQKKMRVYYH